MTALDLAVAAVREADAQLDPKKYYCLAVHFDTWAEIIHNVRSRATKTDLTFNEIFKIGRYHVIVDDSMALDTYEIREVVDKERENVVPHWGPDVEFRIIPDDE